MFVDHVKITAKAGNGGNGGSIILLADENMHTLMDFRFKRKYTAENGGNGAALLCKGKSGQDLIIKVPVGTIVRDTESGRLWADTQYTQYIVFNSISQKIPIRQGGAPSFLRQLRSIGLKCRFSVKNIGKISRFLKISLAFIK